MFIDLSAKSVVSLSLTFIPVAQWPLRMQQTIRNGTYRVDVRLSKLQVKQPAAPTVSREAVWVFWKLLSLPFFCREKGTSDSHPVPLIVPLPLRLAQAWQARCSGAILVCRCLPVLDLPARGETQQCKMVSSLQCSSLLVVRGGRSPFVPSLHWTAKDEGVWEHGWPSLGEDHMFICTHKHI